MAFSRFDADCMAQALNLARRGRYTARPNPCVGAIVAKDGNVLGTGCHLAAGEPHAEVHALRKAGSAARGATLYVTLEPCCHTGRTPPCSEAVIAAGISRVVVAAGDPNPRVGGGGLVQLREAGIDVEAGLLEADAQALNPGFECRMRTGRPLVRLKVAMSLDARTAMASGESQWITGPEARRDVQRLRARSCAVISGSGTVLADDPALTVRPEAFAPGELEAETEERLASLQPLRVVLDSRLQTPPGSRLLNLPGSVWLVHAMGQGKPDAGKYQTCGADISLHCLPAEDGRIDLDVMLEELAGAECNEVLVEAGATLSGAMISAGLVDELVMYIAPSLMGHQARPGFCLPGLETLSDRLDLQIRDVRMVGRDMRITASFDSPAQSG